MSIEQRKKLAAASHRRQGVGGQHVLAPHASFASSAVHKRARGLGRQANLVEMEPHAAELTALQRAVSAANALAPASMLFGSPEDPLFYGNHVIDGGLDVAMPRAQHRHHGDFGRSVDSQPSSPAKAAAPVRSGGVGANIAANSMSPLQVPMWPPSYNGSMMSGISIQGGSLPRHWRDRRAGDIDGGSHNCWSQQHLGIGLCMRSVLLGVL